jgi:DNA mismatch repair protein MLH1
MMATMSAGASSNNMIQVLPKEVVDQIAAGEVVQRAAAALKEMVENSLDAKATEIHVVVHSVSAFTLTDNGQGIPKNDLALACTRHATSKLRVVDDLARIDSFGFRGEALASISMVANVEIHSRTTEAPVGYTQRYANGKPTTTDNKAPTPCARKVGTTIRVTNLFHNLPTRQSLRLANEYAAILKVMQCYAVHYPHISFVCHKADKPADLITKPTKCATDTASALFGLEAKPHAWLDHSHELREDDPAAEEPGTLIYQAQLYISDSSSPRNRNHKAVPPFLLFCQ